MFSEPTCQMKLIKDKELYHLYIQMQKYICGRADILHAFPPSLVWLKRKDIGYKLQSPFFPHAGTNISFGVLTLSYRIPGFNWERFRRFLSHASNLGWWSVSPLIVFLFQCCSLRTSHPRLLPQSPKVCSVHLCLFFCFTYRVIITIFLNSIYMR